MILTFLRMESNSKIIFLRLFTIFGFINIDSSFKFFSVMNISSKNIIFCKNIIILFDTLLEYIFIFSVNIRIKSL